MTALEHPETVPVAALRDEREQEATPTAPRPARRWFRGWSARAGAVVAVLAAAAVSGAGSI